MYRFDNTWKCITNLEISLDHKINCKYAIKNWLRNCPIASYALRRPETGFLLKLKVLIQNFWTKPGFCISDYSWRLPTNPIAFIIFLVFVSQKPSHSHKPKSPILKLRLILRNCANKSSAIAMPSSSPALTAKT